MKNIMVAVDARPSDAFLLSHAEAQGSKFGGKIWILHVATPDPEFVGYEVGPKYLRDFMAGELRQEHRLLQSYAAEMEQRSVAVEALLIQGPTVDMILREIQKLHIDMLIMGSHKHGLLYDMFVGNTATRILKETPVPVLIIPLDHVS